MGRMLLTIQFDGSAYSGWQVQPNGVTVQQRMQDAIEAVFGERYGLTGCSRTDAGVHANAFCCHFDLLRPKQPREIIQALNAHLPSDIAVQACAPVPPSFHARYSCRAKEYIYRIYNAPVRSPFYEGRALFLKYPLQAQALDRASRAFIGRHDFSSLCAAGAAAGDKVRTVLDCGVRRDGALVTFYVTADGFLYHMVRIMVGTLLSVAAEKLQPEQIPAVLEGRSRTLAGPTAAAHGLYLNRVFYEPQEVETDDAAI